MKQVRMPHIDLGGDTAVVREWLVQPGDEFREGDPILEIETDKASMDVEATFDGVLVRQEFEAGETAAVGAVVAYAVEPGGDVEAARAELAADGAPPARSAPPPQEPAAPAVAAAVATAAPSRFVEVEHGELAGLSRVTSPSRAVDDASLAGPFERRALSRRRVTIARRMTAATAVPTFVVHRDITTAAAAAAVARAREEGHRVTLTDVLLKTVGAAAAAHPRVNAWTDGSEVVELRHVGVALAVDTPEGVVAPVVREVDRLPLSEIAARRADLVARARSGALDARELAEGTITLSNVAGLGSHGIVPVLSLPQVAAVGVGTARGDVVTVTFVGDHRVLDGADGARFLETFSEALRTSHDS